MYLYFRSSKASIGPQIPSAFSTSGMLRKIDAPTSGTRWHNEPGTKKWYEAKDDDGNSYFWHVETNGNEKVLLKVKQLFANFSCLESRWDAPPEGYLSLKEQNKIQKGAEKREQKRYEQIQQSQALHGAKADDHEAAGAAQGPAPRADPYGSWEVVESSYEVEAPVDYQVPRAAELPQASVTMHSDKLSKFEEKKTPSLGGATSSTSKPAIVFRKRKVNDEHRKNARRRENDD